MSNIAEDVPPVPVYGLRPPHDRVVAGLVALLTPEWIEGENRQPLHSRHHIVRWLEEIRAFPDRVAPLHGSPDIFSPSPSGDLQELLALAVDVDLLQRTGSLPTELVDRLRIWKEFEGARYELAVAATIARAGLPITWHLGKEGGPEFWAHVASTGERLAVEAKHRSREGVLHKQGTSDAGSYMADVEVLFKKAKRKEVRGCPLIIFIDLNLPDRTDVDAEPAWMPQIRRMLARYDDLGVVEPRSARFALAVFTNFTWHYAGKLAVADRQPSDTYVPARSVRPIRSPGIRDRILQSLESYSAPIPPGIGSR